MLDKSFRLVSIETDHETVLGGLLNLRSRCYMKVTFSIDHLSFFMARRKKDNMERTLNAHIELHSHLAIFIDDDRK